MQLVWEPGFGVCSVQHVLETVSRRCRIKGPFVSSIPLQQTGLYFLVCSYTSINGKDRRQKVGRRSQGNPKYWPECRTTRHKKAWEQVQQGPV